MKIVVVFSVMLGLLAGSTLAQDMRPVPRPERGTSAPVVETVVISSKSPTPRPAGLLNGQEFRQALSAARDGNWQQAGVVSAQSGQVAADVIEWQRLRAGKGDFAAYRAFLARNGDWPGLAYLRKRGEARIGDEADPAQVIGYFNGTAPQTGAGALALARAHLANGEKARGEAVLIAAWIELEMGEATEKAFLKDHATLLKAHHVDRLDFQLWQGERAAASRMLHLVGDDWKALAKARIALQREAGGIDKLIEAVPEPLASDPGLAYDRMAWAVSKRRRDQAADMIIAASENAGTLGQPDNWANWRRTLARQTMRAGDGAKAYALASSHHMIGGSDYADLEWLSGYLALTYLDKPEVALGHFLAFHAEVFTPISLGRAGYWEGRAYEAMGDAEAAKAAYTDGAKHQTSFYGLLAAEKAGVPMDRVLTGLGVAESWRDAGFVDGAVFQAAALFFEAGQTWETVRFLKHLAESLEEADLVRLTDYTLTLGDPFLAVKVGKQAASEGTVAPRAYYPLRPMGDEALPVPEALALAIARRESEFHPAAVSGAGARGLMQLMPGTAREMAGKIGLPYSKARLTSDPEYNIQLGSAYLAHLIDEFGENIVLVSVGYNAGPHRARTWIDARGDPRDPEIDVVDWIEHIPFRETRNYVMRVAESLPVYRARLSGRIEPIELMKELKAK